jgi:hypothetical protein
MRTAEIQTLTPRTAPADPGPPSPFSPAGTSPPSATSSSNPGSARPASRCGSPEPHHPPGAARRPPGTGLRQRYAIAREYHEIFPLILSGFTGGTDGQHVADRPSAA